MISDHRLVKHIIVFFINKTDMHAIVNLHLSIYSKKITVRIFHVLNMEYFREFE